VLGAGLLRATGHAVPTSITIDYPEHAWELWNFAGMKLERWWNELSQKFSGGDGVAEVVVRVYLADLLRRLELNHLTELSSKHAKSLVSYGDLTRWNQMGGIEMVLGRLQVNSLNNATTESHLSSQVDTLFHIKELK